MQDDESTALTIKATQRGSEINELRSGDRRSREYHRIQSNLAPASLPPVVIQELSQEDASSPRRKGRWLLQLSEALVHSTEGVAHKYVGIHGSSCERAREWQKLGGQTLQQPCDRLGVARESGFSQEIRVAHWATFMHSLSKTGLTRL